MYVGPQHWARLGDTTPADRDGWVARLGGSGAAIIAVLGAIRRGLLVDIGDGDYAMTDAPSPDLPADPGPSYRRAIAEPSGDLSPSHRLRQGLGGGR